MKPKMKKPIGKEKRDKKTLIFAFISGFGKPKIWIKTNRNEWLIDFVLPKRLKKRFENSKNTNQAPTNQEL